MKLWFILLTALLPVLGLSAAKSTMNLLLGNTTSSAKAGFNVSQNSEKIHNTVKLFTANIYNTEKSLHTFLLEGVALKVPKEANVITLSLRNRRRQHNYDTIKALLP